MSYLTQNSDQLDYSSIIFSLGFCSYQFFDKKLNVQNKKSLINFLVFLIPSIEFSAILLAGTFVNFLFLFLFSSFKASRIVEEISASRKPAFRNRNFKIKTLSFFYLLFLFFIRNFFNNNINTSNVIVDTSDLLYSKGKILETNKELCFLEKSVEMDYFLNVSFSLINKF